ncbi:electron transfer flavoprotein alpha subunit [Caballeronia udeis]|uniref:Electron transfer flavoprotein alpha subunit n=1 Tax=Caballeronia udeis TaxID=1232866 RepID=A0ABW8MJA6_9BURK
MSILVIADVLDDAVLSSTHNTIAAARQLSRFTNTDVHLLVAGHQLETAVESAASSGVDKVLLADAAHLADRGAENLAAVVLGLSQSGYSHLLFGANNFGKNVAPRVAAKLDVAQFSDVVAVKGEAVFDRPIYAGNIMATVEAFDSIKVLTVRSTAFPAGTEACNASPVEPCVVPEDRFMSRVTSRQAAVSDRPDLSSAPIVVSGGRGLGSKDNYTTLLEPLADKLGAALGASRAAVDAGYASNERQVGQTGKIVAPDIYVAVGLSGAIQHLAGMRDSRIIVAINSDKDAPIFGVANYGLVADLFDVVPQWLTST